MPAAWLHYDRCTCVTWSRSFGRVYALPALLSLRYPHISTAQILLLNTSLSVPEYDMSRHVRLAF